MLLNILTKKKKKKHSKILNFSNMNKTEILFRVANSISQPAFSFSYNLDDVVDSILKSREDYFLGINPKVKEIIERTINDAKNCDSFRITFADVCNWQKELFEYKKFQIRNAISLKTYGDMEDVIKAKKAEKLLNQRINLGLRTTNIKVGNWTPPAPMFLEDLKEMCFPIQASNTLKLGDICEGGSILTDNHIKYWLIKWYKIFQTIHFFEDFNDMLGAIVINILSYVLTGKYLIKI